METDCYIHTNRADRMSNDLPSAALDAHVHAVKEHVHSLPSEIYVCFKLPFPCQLEAWCVHDAVDRRTKVLHSSATLMVLSSHTTTR